MRAAIYRPAYRGEVVWNRTTTRRVRGRWRQVPQPESEWVRVASPELRIVTDERMGSRAPRLTEVRNRALRLRNGQVIGRPPATGSARYLLSGPSRLVANSGRGWLQYTSAKGGAQSYGGRSRRARARSISCPI